MRSLFLIGLLTILPGLLVVAGCGSTPSIDTPSGGPSATHNLLLPGAPGGATTVTGPLAGRANVEAFIARMEREGFQRDQVVYVLSRVKLDPWIIEYMNKQWRPAGGPTGAWTKYRNRHITDAMLAKGAAFWNSHEAALNRASAQTGVPPEYVVAIIGIETKWGGYMGEHRIVDALATLAFDYPRRAEYFQDELAQFLLMASEEGFDPFSPVGSFAGAMGLGQFMPSSWHDYALDHDGDGHRNLWDAEDAIGSVANYFAKHGWRSGEAVAVPASGGSGLPSSMDTGFKTRYPVASLQAKGLTPAVALPADKQVSLLRLDAVGGYEYWFGLDNFFVITRYNNSTYYGMTVHQMAKALRKRHGGSTPARVAEQPRGGAAG